MTSAAHTISARRGLLFACLLSALPTLGWPSVPPPMAVEAFVMGLPKAELHIHFEGTIEPEHYLELIERNGLERRYPDADAVRQRLEHARDLDTFIEVYEELLSVMHTADDFEAVAMAYFERVAAQGTVYVEMFFDPQMHTYRGIDLETVMAGLAAARDRAAAELALEVWFIACFNRDRSAESALAHLEAIRPWSDIIIGVGLDNPEEIGFPEKFAGVFRRAGELGFRLTTHLDVNVPNTLAHHWGALEVLNVERFDHGLNTLDDPELIAEVKARGIGLTACPTLLYRDIPGRLEARLGAIRRLLEHGVIISIHSDDPGLMRSLYIGDLYLLAHVEGGFGREEILALVRNGFRTAWIDDDRRRALLAAVDEFAEAHPADF